MKKIIIGIIVVVVLLAGGVLYSNHADAVNAEAAHRAAHQQDMQRIETLQSDIAAVQQHLTLCDIAPKCAPSLKRELQKELAEKRDTLAGAENAAR